MIFDLFPSDSDRERGISKPSPVVDWGHELNFSVAKGVNFDEVEEINGHVAHKGC